MALGGLWSPNLRKDRPEIYSKAIAINLSQLPSWLDGGALISVDDQGCGTSVV